MDVLKLKSHIWDLVAEHSEAAITKATAEEGSENQSPPNAPAPAPAPASAPVPVPVPVAGCTDHTLVGIGAGLSFQDVINTLAPEESADVTTPFYFVCMLHLANEHGLTLQGQRNLKDFKVYPSKVETAGQEGGLHL